MLAFPIPQATAPEAPVAAIRVLFFGKVGDLFGRAMEIPIPAGGCSIADLKARLGACVEGGAAALSERGVRLAVDHDITGDEAWVRPGQEVAFFSMFSGG